MTLSSTSQLPDEIRKEVKKASLRYISDSIPGILRKKHGTGFSYWDASQKKVTDKEVITRINDLKIPPAWDHVWISPIENGHIQATGRDEKGRKQYIYHTEWSKIMQQNKFNKLVSFAELLPALRREIRAGMEELRLNRRRVLSTIIWILEHTYIRIGNPEYAKENQSYGLTTLRNKHVDIKGDSVKFEFKGKSGKFHSVEITHPRVAKTIRKLEELPGYELFQYIDEDGNKKVIQSEDVNEYLQSITGEEITAKDFRTWGGTVFAGQSLYEIGPFTSKTQALKNVSHAVRKVSQHLRNTTAVCRSYYIHPTVINAYEKEVLVPHFEECMKRNDRPRLISCEEYAISTLLKNSS